MSLFRVMQQQAPQQPDRPTHFRDDQNERDVSPMLEYPVEAGDVPDIDYGHLPAPNPQPVYLTESPPSDRTMRAWSPQSMAITGAVVQLTGSDRRRTRLVVANNDTDATVYLSRRKADLEILAFPLAPGDSVEMFHNDEVWAHASSGDVSAPVGWFAEYELGDS